MDAYIRFDTNSDCWGELDELKELLRQNKGYLAAEFSKGEIVTIAVDELYDKLVAEKKAGINQRRVY